MGRAIGRKTSSVTLFALSVEQDLTSISMFDVPALAVSDAPELLVQLY
jgi:hypothetical protein